MDFKIIKSLFVSSAAPFAVYRFIVLLFLSALLAACPSGSGEDSSTVTVNKAPVANAGLDQTRLLGDIVQLDGTSSSDVDGDNISYKWDFVTTPNSSGTSLSDATSPMPTFMIDLVGDYVVQLIVNDGEVDSTADSVTVSVSNSKPVADAGADQTLAVGSLAQLDGSGSTDVDNHPLTYDWTISSQPVNSLTVLDNTSIVKPSFALDQPGDYEVTLMVNDGFESSAPDSVIVSVTNSRPVADAGLNQTVTVGDMVTLDGNNSSDADNDPLSYQWSIITSPSSSTAGLNNANRAIANFTPDVDGLFVLQLIVSDPFVDSLPDTSTITVEAQVVMTDSDGDGLTDAEEATLGTNPNDSDSDNDGLSDGDEVNTWLSNPLNSDSDNDGLTDGDEVNTHNTNPNNKDTDGDGANDQAEIAAATDPNDDQDFPAVGIPPDPSTVASVAIPGESPSIKGSTEFLYTGANPIQRGVNPDDIKAAFAAVVRGKVMLRGGVPLPGVTITVLDHPEYGNTQSRDDGVFDLVVNGGEDIVVVYKLDGYASAQRRVSTKWNDWFWADDVVLVPLDPIANIIDLSSSEPYQVARGSVESDADGSRQATLLFPAGTTAQMLLPDGSRQDLSTLTVRATEFTVGDDGRTAMPAALPPSTAYTYAAELSVDEAIAANAVKVEFSQPVSFYLENFLNFPAGSWIPVGFYNEQLGIWEASEDGLIIQVISETGGAVDIDIDGDGVADDPTTIETKFGITVAERVQLAQLYEPGDSLWRVQTSHFTAIDCNPLNGPIPDDTLPPISPKPKKYPSDRDKDSAEEDPCEQAGSIIECQSQVLRESVPLNGMPVSLNYRSDRSQENYRIKANITDDRPLPGVTGIVATFKVAGRSETRIYPAQTNQTDTFLWDGYDAYGRFVYGGASASLNISYQYPVEYILRRAGQADPTQSSFGAKVSGGLYIDISGRSNGAFVGRTYDLGIIGTGDSRDIGLGGWTLDVHHRYEPISKTLSLGTGERRSANNYNDLNVEEVGNTNSTAYEYSKLLIDNDGTKYIAARCRGASLCSDGGILKIFTPEVAQQLGYDSILIGKDPASTIDWNIRDISFGPDGYIYFIGTPDGVYGSNSYFGRINKDGGEKTILIDNFPGQAHGIAFDAMGGVYISQTLDSVIRYIPGNLLRTGNVSLNDAEVAITLQAYYPTRMAVSSEGNLFVLMRPAKSSAEYQVHKYAPDGTVTHVAGRPADDPFDPLRDGTGGLAIEALLNLPNDIFPDNNGGFYIAESRGVRYVDVNGIISNVMGNLTSSRWYDIEEILGTPASDIRAGANSVTIGQDKQIYATLTGRSFALIKLAPTLPGFSATNIDIASQDGQQLYRFSRVGRHLQTLDTLTGDVLYSFTYSPDGYLSSIIDTNGRVLSIERSGEKASAIIGTDGTRNEIGISAADWMNRITNPAGDSMYFSYDVSLARLTSMTDFNSNVYNFVWDQNGFLLSDANPMGGAVSLTVAEDPKDSWREITKTDPNGLETSYRRETQGDGTLLYTNVFPEGGTNTTLIDKTGLVTRNLPNGTVVSVRRSPDPRFGMHAPLSSGSLQTPGGRNMTWSSSRQVVLDNPNDILSLRTQSANWTVGNNSLTTTFNRVARTMTKEISSRIVEVGTYDSDWRLINHKRPGLESQSFVYDSVGKILSSSWGDQTITRGYDALGRISLERDALGHEIGYSYDIANNLIGRTLPSGKKVVMGYDKNSNMTSLKMPSGALHTMTYNSLNQMQQYADPNGNSTTMVYDKGGRRTSSTFASNDVLVHNYDSAGRIASETYLNTEVRFTYVPNTNSLSMTEREVNGGSVQSVANNWDGHLAVGTTFSGPANGTFTYDYDSSLQLNSTKLDAGAPLIDVFTSDGLISSHGPFSLDRYRDTGLPFRWRDGTVNVNYEHDTLGRMTRRWHEVGGTTTYDLVLTYDKSGKIMARTETVGGTRSDYVYSYGNNGELLTVTRNGSQVEQYLYDDNVNRISANGTSAIYDVSDRVTTVGGVNYNWDVNGFLTGRGSDTFAYSVRGELLSANANGVLIKYHYDGLRRMTARTVGSETTQFLYGNPLALHLLTHSRAPDGSLTTYFYDEAGLLHAFERGGQMYYVAVDQVGSPRLIFDATGAAIRSIEYNAWGEVISDSNPTFDLTIGFAGGITDKDTGLVRFLLRDYDSLSGRWTARDPAGFDGGLNLYMYANSDPVQYRDPLGLFCMGANAYAGIGGGLKTCYKDGKWSLCGEVGVGAGAGLEVEPLGKPDRTERFVKAVTEVSVGPLAKASIDFKYTDCGRSDGTGVYDEKPGCTIATVDCSGKKVKSLDQVDNISDLTKFNAQATVTAGACARF